MNVSSSVAAPRNQDVNDRRTGGGEKLPYTGFTARAADARVRAMKSIRESGSGVDAAGRGIVLTLELRM
jgi:hypothetical protein